MELIIACCIVVFVVFCYLSGFAMPKPDAYRRRDEKEYDYDEQIENGYYTLIDGQPVPTDNEGHILP